MVNWYKNPSVRDVKGYLSCGIVGIWLEHGWRNSQHKEMAFPQIDKAYPRDFMQRGMRESEGKQLMLRIAEVVPRHLGRTKKQEPASSSTAGPSKGNYGRKKK
uniref:Uncharacterized protein n=1 Tax=Cucumis melo TaxID=3656 RepID=A0A9I9EGP1_CUCME